MPQLMDLGMTAAEVLRTLTSVAAEVCRLGDRKGRIAVGYDADILAVRGNPLAEPRPSTASAPCTAEDGASAPDPACSSVRPPAGTGEGSGREGRRGRRFSAVAVCPGRGPGAGGRAATVQPWRP